MSTILCLGTGAVLVAPPRQAIQRRVGPVVREEPRGGEEGEATPRAVSTAPLPPEAPPLEMGVDGEPRLLRGRADDADVPVVREEAARRVRRRGLPREVGTRLAEVEMAEPSAEAVGAAGELPPPDQPPADVPEATPGLLSEGTPLDGAAGAGVAAPEGEAHPAPRCLLAVGVRPRHRPAGAGLLDALPLPEGEAAEREASAPVRGVEGGDTAAAERIVAGAADAEGEGGGGAAEEAGEESASPRPPP